MNMRQEQHGQHGNLKLVTATTTTTTTTLNITIHVQICTKGNKPIVSFQLQFQTFCKLG